MPEEKTTIIKIDFWSVAKIVLAVLVLWFLYLIRDVILILFIAGLLAAIITPAVNYFERKRIPRWIGAVIVYLVVLLILTSIGLAVIPTVVTQSKLLISQLPDFLKSFFGETSTQTKGEFINLLNGWLSKSAISGKTIFSILGTVTGQMVSLFMIFIIAFYLSIKKKSIRVLIDSFILPKYQRFLEHLVIAVQRDIGAWGRGLCFLCLFVGILVYLGLTILGVKYALVLAVIAGLVEVIPYVGPWLSGIIAAIVALPQSSTLALLVIILFIIIQQIENTVVSPYIMHRAVGLDPLVVIIVLLIGGKVAGPIGMILAVPAATIVAIIIRYYLEHKQEVAEN